jgi:hypothetical protein
VILQSTPLDDAEPQSFPHGIVSLVEVAGRTVGRGVLQPGWRWSTDMQALEGTASCAKGHFGYLVAGALGVRMDDGAELTIHVGEVFTMEQLSQARR